MAEQDIRTIEEAYTSATHSSDLSINDRDIKAVDLLIASAKCSGELGLVLHNLRNEWDDSAKPMKMDMTAALLLRAKLKSLKKALELFTKWSAAIGSPEPARLADECLAYWLDNTCPTCFGRGKTPAPGTGTLAYQCKSCGGTGNRKEPQGEMGRKLLNFFEECLANRGRNIGREKNKLQKAKKNL